MNWKKLGLGASLVSILGSIAIYFGHDHDLGIFVGLWASALLLLSDRMAELSATKVVVWLNSTPFPIQKWRNFYDNAVLSQWN